MRAFASKPASVPLKIARFARLPLFVAGRRCTSIQQHQSAVLTVLLRCCTVIFYVHFEYSNAHVLTFHTSSMTYQVPLVNRTGTTGPPIMNSRLLLVVPGVHTCVRIYDRTGSCCAICLACVPYRMSCNRTPYVWHAMYDTKYNRTRYVSALFT